MSHAVIVVVVNWNCGEMILRCLSAVLCQTYQPDRILVIDNGSSDNSKFHIKTKFPSVEVIEAGTNLGFAAANNLALSLIDSSSWVALLNPDATPMNNWLEKLVDAADQNPAYEFFASRMLSEQDPTRLDGAGDAYHTSGTVWRRGYRCPARYAYTKNYEIFSPCAAAALYKTELLRQVGGFDEDFFCYLEDVDLGFRLRLQGRRALYVAEAVVLHAGSATTGKNSDFTIYHGHRNLVWTYVKNMPGSLFWIYLPWHLIINVGTIILFAFRGKPRVILRAKYDALLGLRKMWKKRKVIQASRATSSWQMRRLMTRGWPTRRCKSP